MLFLTRPTRREISVDFIAFGGRTAPRRLRFARSSLNFRYGIRIGLRCAVLPKNDNSAWRRDDPAPPCGKKGTMFRRAARFSSPRPTRAGSRVRSSPWTAVRTS